MAAANCAARASGMSPPRGFQSGMVPRMKATIAVLMSALLLAACGGSSAKSPSADQSRSPGSQASTASATPSEAAGIPFGGTHIFTSGVSFTVAPPRRIFPRPSSSGCGLPLSRSALIVVFDITIKNGSARPYQQGGQTAQLRIGGVQAAPFCDDKQNVDVAPLKPIPPGGSSTFALGFQIVQRAALELTLPESGTGAKAVFTGADPGP